jgi:hypothetical protein
MFYLGRKYLVCKVLNQKEFFLMDFEYNDETEKWIKDKFDSVENWLNVMKKESDEVEDIKIITL